MISPQNFARYAAMRVPRYTSYPTAPNFSSAVGGEEYRDWLRKIEAGEPTSIYLHIPFCREMCWYCGCHTSVTRRSAPISRYVATLAREIRIVTAELRARPAIAHLHWGGGSPTLLSPEAIDELSQLLRERFDIQTGAELAVEVDPRTLGEDVALAFARNGVNRASVGVQSFDPVVQSAINRVQSFATTKGAVDLLRASGIARINFDLVYGLPFQSVESCVSTVEQALELRPDRLSIFGYAHVPSFKAHQRRIDESALGNEGERHEQFQSMVERLVAEGYVQLGLDHFALPQDSLALAAATGTLNRNFQGYTTDACTSLIGFGASAIGHLAQGYVQNATRIPDYERRIAGGNLAVVRGYELDDDDRRRAAIIAQLMCTYEADLEGIPADLGQLEADGLVRRSGNRIRVSAEARPLVRAIAARFDAYLPNSAGKHVPAI